MMRLSSIFSESFRNVRGGTAHSGQLTLALGALISVVMAVDFIAIAAVTTQADAFRNAGASVQIYESKGQISGSACEALNSVGGYRSGAIRAAPFDLTMLSLPGSTVPTFEVSPQFADVLGDLDDKRLPLGLTVSASFAEQFGVGAGSQLQTSDGDTVIASVYDFPNDGRRSELSYAVLIPVPADAPFDECWGSTWPISEQMGSLLRSTVLQSGADGQDPPILGQLNSSFGADFPGNAMIEKRSTQYLPIFGAIFGFIIAFVATRIRGIELASARHSGVGAFELWSILMIESTAWILGSAAFSTPVIAYFQNSAAVVDRPLFLQLGATTFGIATCAALLGVTGSVLFSDERRLFGLFKSRR